MIKVKTATTNCVVICFTICGTSELVLLSCQMQLQSIAYFPSWAIYSSNFNVWDINPEGLTHLSYAFANIVDGEVVLGDLWADIQKANIDHEDSTELYSKDMLHGNLLQLFLLKSKYRWIKTGISVGGWSWSANFSDVAATEESRRKFAASAIKFALDYGMDFVDLDWEFPVQGGLEGNVHRPEDAYNFVLLLKELKEQFAQHPDHPLALFIATGAFLNEKIYNYVEMDKYVDRYNMMCYDFTGSWSQLVDHHSNLEARDTEHHSAKKAIQFAINQGADPQKIIMGVPLYGRGFAETKGLLESFSGVGEGTYGEPGYYPYRGLPVQGSSEHWDAQIGAPYCYDNEKKLLISYDNYKSVENKLNWIIEMGLGGVMLWELSGDPSYDSSCSIQKIIHRTIGNRMDKTPNNMAYPNSPYKNIRDCGQAKCCRRQ